MTTPTGARCVVEFHDAEVDSIEVSLDVGVMRWRFSHLCIYRPDKTTPTRQRIFSAVAELVFERLAGFTADYQVIECNRVMGADLEGGEPLVMEIAPDARTTRVDLSSAVEFHFASGSRISVRSVGATLTLLEESFLEYFEGELPGQL